MFCRKSAWADFWVCKQSQALCVWQRITHVYVLAVVSHARAMDGQSRQLRLQALRQQRAIKNACTGPAAVDPVEVMKRSQASSTRMQLQDVVGRAGFLRNLQWPLGLLGGRQRLYHQQHKIPFWLAVAGIIK